jgi:hypothetical protein
MLAGGLFGIFDYFFQVWIFQLIPVQTGEFVLIPVLGVWLVLVVPIALREAKISNSLWLTAASSAFTWSSAVIAYYLYLGVDLILIGKSARPEMHISNSSAPFYWENIKNFFEGDVLGGISEWIIVALVGGSLIGLLVGFLSLRALKRLPSSD